jgi:hypothetical protein
MYRVLVQCTAERIGLGLGHLARTHARGAQGFTFHTPQAHTYMDNSKLDALLQLYSVTIAGFMVHTAGLNRSN